MTYRPLCYSHHSVIGQISHTINWVIPSLDDLNKIYIYIYIFIQQVLNSHPFYTHQPPPPPTAFPP